MNSDTPQTNQWNIEDNQETNDKSRNDESTHDEPSNTEKSADLEETSNDESFFN